jgi:VCBS repeat-containing protein
VGAVIGNLTTTDPDAGDTHSYTVDDARFEVVAGLLKLKAGQSLDFETEPSVNVTVTSTDAGGLNTNQLFSITVTNVNETPTAISLDNSTVAENAAGAIIGNLTTTDPDAGDTHTYTVDDARFEVMAGQLKLKAGQSLDFETEPSVNVTVTSTDAGGLNTNQLFAITVTNVNETPTAISLDNSTVAENAAGAVIGNLTTTDPDAGDTHGYTVDDARFEVVAGLLKLKAGQSLDFETEPSVNVTVTSTDAGGLSTNQLFAITVTNVNETPTAISLDNSTVAENAAGAVIGNLTTTDPDAGDTHSYTVDDVRFEVVAGQLKLKAGQSLDFETEPSVNVTVTSTDAGGLSTNQLFAITVTNVNETPTAISLDNATVAENAAGAIIGNLTTTDPDAGDTHSYTVNDARFEVVAGQLKLKAGQSLDFETEPSVNVTVTSTDAGGLSTNQLFAITVTNVNETPTAISLDSSTVAENAAGAVIGNLTTTDPDAGDTHSYTVDDARFEVVAGQLKLKAGQSLDFETEPSVNVTVTSTDAGGLSTNQLFAITVSNVNDPPVVSPAGSDTGTEDTDKVYTHAQMLALIGASDVDDVDADLYISISNVVNGTVSLSGGTGGIGTVFTFTPDADFFGNMTFDYQVFDDDLAVSAMGAATVAVTPVNDSPTVSTTASDAGTEDTVQVYTHAEMLALIGATDMDDVDANLSINISNVVNGSVVLSGGMGGGGTTFTFAPDRNFAGNMTFDYLLSDDDLAASATGTATVAFTPVNDAPTATNMNTAEALTNASAVDLTDIIVSDVDNVNVTVTLTLSDPSAGSLSTGTSGAVTSIYDGVTGVWSASGSVADLNNLLKGVTFGAALDYHGSFTIATKVDDGAGATITGIKNMIGTPPGDTSNEEKPDDGDDDSPIDPVDAPDDNGDPEDIPSDKAPEEKRDRSHFLSVQNHPVTAKPALPELTTENKDDAVLTSRQPSKLARNEAVDLPLNKGDLYASVEISQDQIQSIDRQEVFFRKAFVGTALSLTAGVATWALRIGSLLTSAITSMPLWKGFDPLPVLPFSRKKRRERLKEIRMSEEKERRKEKEVTELFDTTNGDHATNQNEDDPS